MEFDNLNRFDRNPDARLFDKHGHQVHPPHRNPGHNSFQDFSQAYNLSYILEKIKNNRNLKIWIAVLGALFVAILVVAAIILIPLIIKLVNFISQFGIQGVVDTVTEFLGKIWKGTGK